MDNDSLLINRCIPLLSAFTTRKADISRTRASLYSEARELFGKLTDFLRCLLVAYEGTAGLKGSSDWT